MNEEEPWLVVQHVVGTAVTSIPFSRRSFSTEFTFFVSAR